MTDTNIYIRTLYGIDRQIEWTELNELKKDILWIFSENTNQLKASFVPDDSFKNKYWEYLSIDGNKWFYEEDRNFYKQGVLVIILCMTIEYIDTAGGNQKIFGQVELSKIIQHVSNFEPTHTDQKMLKEIVELGLKIANSMTELDLLNSNEYEHKDLGRFYSQLDWVDTTFIKSYFQALIK